MATITRLGISVLCGVLVLAACGDDGAVTTSAVVTAAPTTVATTIPDPTTAEVVVLEIPPCDLLTADEVAAATGLEVVEVMEEPPITCIFDLGSDAGVDLFVTVEDAQGRLGGPAAVFEGYSALVDDGEAEAVTGLGAAAFYAAGFRGLAVDGGGGRFIGLGINGGYQHLTDPRDALVSLAALALGRL
jgi:hypothetical protein